MITKLQLSNALNKIAKWGKNYVSGIILQIYRNIKGSKTVNAIYNFEVSTDISGFVFGMRN